MSHNYREKPQVLDELSRVLVDFLFFLLRNETTVDKYLSDTHLFHNRTMIHSHLAINPRASISSHAPGQK